MKKKSDNLTHFRANFNKILNALRTSLTKVEADQLYTSWSSTNAGFYSSCNLFACAAFIAELLDKSNFFWEA